MKLVKAKKVAPKKVSAGMDKKLKTVESKPMKKSMKKDCK